MDELFLTADGSHSILSEEHQVPYHSRHGAIQESKHVFIEAGLHQFKKSNAVSILEVGFGTGLNALLTALEAQFFEKEISYVALETHPLDQKTWEVLNYPKQLLNSLEIFNQIHLASWGIKQQIHSTFSIEKREEDFLAFTEKEKYDLIYFDAFAPNAQPELWTTEALGIFTSALKPGGILTTYCAKGVVRRSFLSLDCAVERIPGPPGKREMLRVKKD